MNPPDLGADLERLPGVLAATLFLDEDRGPLVYLATSPGTDRDALRHAVLTLLADRGLHSEADRIHIATPRPGPGSGAPLPAFALDALDVHRSNGRAECTVYLRTGARSLTGSGREPDTATGRARAGARAVLDAAESLDPDLRLGLHGVRRLDLFGQEALAVLVEASVGRAYAQLPGTALLDRSLEEAGAIAVLRALRSWTATR